MWLKNGEYYNAMISNKRCLVDFINSVFLDKYHKHKKGLADKLLYLDI